MDGCLLCSMAKNLRSMRWVFVTSERYVGLVPCCGQVCPRSQSLQQHTNSYQTPITFYLFWQYKDSCKWINTINLFGIRELNIISSYNKRNSSVLGYNCKNYMIIFIYFSLSSYECQDLINVWTKSYMISREV